MSHHVFTEFLMEVFRNDMGSRTLNHVEHVLSTLDMIFSVIYYLDLHEVRSVYH